LPLSLADWRFGLGSDFGFASPELPYQTAKTRFKHGLYRISGRQKESTMRGPLRLTFVVLGGTMPYEVEPEQIVERYRSLIDQLEIATHDAHKAEVKEAAKRLRRPWKESQGEDNLHETAFGEKS